MTPRHGCDSDCGMGQQAGEIATAGRMSPTKAVGTKVFKGRGDVMGGKEWMSCARVGRQAEFLYSGLPHMLGCGCKGGGARRGWSEWLRVEGGGDDISNDISYG